ncbi:molybdenum cofactor guanylyltransferase [Chloroflexota bacterium]
MVLAGGRSQRLGRYKALETIGNESFIQRVITRLSEVDEVIVVTSPRFLPVLAAQHLGVRLVVDVLPDLGPLGGIHSGLLAARGRYGLVVGCDMPFLKPRLLEYLLELRSGFDIVVPRVRGLPEPLHAVYSRECIPVIECQVQLGKKGVHQLLEEVRVRYVEEEELDRFDPEHISLFNVNSVADIEKANEMMMREKDT